MRFLILFLFVLLYACQDVSTPQQAVLWTNGYWNVDSVQELSTVYDGPNEAYVDNENSFYTRNESDSTWSVQPVVTVDTVAPTGVLTPTSIGQIVIDTVGTDSVYIATGLTSSDWVQI